MERVIQGLDSILKPIEWFVAMIAGVVVMILMVQGCVEVLGRSVFNSPIHGNLDIVEQLMVLVAALGISYCQSKFGNVRMTLLLNRATGRTKWLMEILALAIAAFVVFVWVKGSFANFWRAWKFGGDTPEIGIPLWIGMLVVSCALSLLLVRLAVQLLEALRLVISPEAPTRIFHDPVEDALAVQE